jgi:hypothetical protein
MKPWYRLHEMTGRMVSKIRRYISNFDSSSRWQNSVEIVTCLVEHTDLFNAQLRRKIVEIYNFIFGKDFKPI